MNQQRILKREPLHHRSKYWRFSGIMPTIISCNGLIYNLLKRFDIAFYDPIDTNVQKISNKFKGVSCKF